MVSPEWVRLNYGTNPENLDAEGNARVRGAFDMLPGWQLFEKFFELGCFVE